jgi:hypothetical protein
MNNAIELDWPTLGTEVADKIVRHYEQYKHYGKRFKKIQDDQSMTKAEFQEETRGAYKLEDWPEHMQFITDIFSGHIINRSFLHHITMQRSIDELEPHTDTFRTMSVIYVVEGSADTVFYEQPGLTNNSVPARRFNKAELIEVNRYKFDLNKWYLINNSAIHGVDNYIGKRTSLTFDLTDLGVFTDYQDAVTKIKHSRILFL